MPTADPSLLGLCLAGVGVGLLLLWRGFGGYRAAARIGDTSTSRIATLAAGEVRISGVVERAEVTLVSPLQSRDCVWYRSRIRSGGRDEQELFAEERGIGFRIRDASGSIRVFPRGARIDAPDRFAERTGPLGDEPPGLALRGGSPFTTPAEDREAAIAALLTVRVPDPDPELSGLGGGSFEDSGRRYEEARLEEGDVITVVGTALPFGHLEDPSGADRLDRYGDPLAGLDDPEVAAEVAEARAAGTLLTPEEAWGNAAIPGFGIGRPVRAPELDEGVTAPVLATPEEAARIEQVFDLEPDLLVVAAAPDSPLLIATGTPGEAVAREEGRFLVGLLGAVLAIGSAVAGALLLATG
ncbi:MAG: hypothetical protein AB1627_11485 [Chloroflexota bacterium]